MVTCTEMETVKLRSGQIDTLGVKVTKLADVLDTRGEVERGFILGLYIDLLCEYWYFLSVWGKLRNRLRGHLFRMC